MSALRQAIPGLSQVKLGHIVGLSPTAISQIERGVNHPRYENAAAIDLALEADGALLRAFGYVSSPDQPESVSPGTVLELAGQLKELAARVEELGAEVARLKRGGARGSG